LKIIITVFETRRESNPSVITFHLIQASGSDSVHNF